MVLAPPVPLELAEGYIHAMIRIVGQTETLDSYSVFFFAYFGAIGAVRVL